MVVARRESLVACLLACLPACAQRRLTQFSPVIPKARTRFAANELAPVLSLTPYLACDCRHGPPLLQSSRFQDLRCSSPRRLTISTICGRAPLVLDASCVSLSASSQSRGERRAIGCRCTLHGVDERLPPPLTTADCICARAASVKPSTSSLAGSKPFAYRQARLDLQQPSPAIPSFVGHGQRASGAKSGASIGAFCIARPCCSQCSVLLRAFALLFK